MGSSDSPPTAPSAEFLAAFRARAPHGRMTFAEFMELALYHPELGYYRRHRPRVGYGGETDFYTASTSGPIFGELISAAIGHRLEGRPKSGFTFVEVGAEPGKGILTGVDHGFAAVREIRVGEPIAISGPCVVFSNELFDAQPFRRFVSREGRWREIGVEVVGDALVESDLATTLPAFLPANAPDGYTIDAPLAAADLARQIAAQPWTGLFIAADYGKTWEELAQATPEGTARAYHRHRQSNALLAAPGFQDLTCHVCWDWLSDALKEARFRDVKIESQESFLVRHSGEFIARTTAAEASRFSQKKLSLLQLLHPSHLGQKFQVLHAGRF